MRSFFKPNVLVALALVVAGCSSAGAEPTATTTATTTTVPATTVAPTTTVPPIATVALGFDMPDGMADPLNSLYSWLVDDRNAPPTAPQGLLDHIADLDRVDPGSAGTASWATLQNGDSVAVATVDEDVVLLVEDGSGWRIVGAALAGTTPWLGESPHTVLILGSDARVGENQQTLRADSVHILTVVPEEGAGAIVGFPRDSWVQSPSGGSTKLTNLMAGNGPQIMLETITEMTQLDIDGYFVTGFAGFTGLINALGGLYIDLPTKMRSGNSWADYPAGPQTLNAQLALRLARIRKGLPGGDFDRSFNQGLIMQAAMEMIQGTGIETLPEWVRILSENTWTDLSTDQVLNLGAAALLLDPNSLVNTVVPGHVGTAGSASVVYLDEAAEDVYRDLDDGLIDATEE